MNLIQGYLDYMKRIGRIQERMTRTEFWPYFILNFGLLYVLGFVIAPLGIDRDGILSSLAFVVVLIFCFGPIIQRLNDAHLRRRFLLVLLIPYVGLAIVALMLLKPSFPATTQYGPCKA